MNTVAGNPKPLTIKLPSLRNADALRCHQHPPFPWQMQQIGRLVYSSVQLYIVVKLLAFTSIFNMRRLLTFTVPVHLHVTWVRY